MFGFLHPTFSTRPFAQATPRVQSLHPGVHLQQYDLELGSRSDTFPYSQNKPCLYQMKLIVWVEQWQKVSLLLPGELQLQAQPWAQHSSHAAEHAPSTQWRLLGDEPQPHTSADIAHNRWAKLSLKMRGEITTTLSCSLSCVAAVEESLRTACPWCTHSGKSTGCFAPRSHLLTAAGQKQGAGQDRAPWSRTQPWLELGCTEPCSSASPAPPSQPSLSKDRADICIPPPSIRICTATRNPKAHRDMQAAQQDQLGAFKLPPGRGRSRQNEAVRHRAATLTHGPRVQGDDSPCHHGTWPLQGTRGGALSVSSAGTAAPVMENSRTSSTHDALSALFISHFRSLRLQNFLNN